MTKTIKIPYGKKHIEMSLPAKNLQEVLEPNSLPAYDEAGAVREALDNPINSRKLEELTKNIKKILIISDDNTRPMPSKKTIPLITERFFHPQTHYDITILIATGLHRRMTEEEITERFGEELKSNYRIINHVASDDNALKYYGKLSTGNELWLNKLLGENDLIIAEGFIEPHFFAGFSGGRKSILPGVSGARTIMYNHRPENIANPQSSIANLETIRSTTNALRRRLNQILDLY